MNLESGQDLQEAETSREWRVKIALLVVALVLVAGYASTLADIRGTLTDRIGALLDFPFPLASVAAVPPSSLVVFAVAAAFILGIALLLRRGRAGSASPASAETADALAGLAGRRTFLEAVARQFELHARQGRQFAIHIVDFDRFHAVNEALGEAEGDLFLRRVAERLLLLVEHADRLARLGDDEFAVIQPEAGGARHAEIYARRIQDALKEVSAQLPRNIRPGASIGIAVAPDHGSGPAQLLHSASLALRAAKQVGGEGFKVYGREMEMAVEARLQMERVIGEGLHSGWFELHYQPQYDLGSRRLTGFEALLRMNHPDRGELQPAAFIPIAEESGLIQPLGEWVLGEALATAAHWPPHLMLSVNVSAAQFRHGDVAATLLRALTAAGFQGARLRVEISEAIFLNGSESVQDQLRRLHAAGISIVVDDFGLSSSSLKALSRFPCDAVKLDRSFVQHVGEQPEIETLLRSLIGTAQAFDLKVLAEGVERAEQAHFLLSNDCRNVQGFLFGRPAPTRDLGAIIAKDLRNTLAGEPAPAGGSSATMERRA